jgi:predicted adenine nucleotide alpha hydrolase (AANH) superfamily ATPase
VLVPVYVNYQQRFLPKIYTIIRRHHLTSSSSGITIKNNEVFDVQYYVKNWKKNQNLQFVSEIFKRKTIFKTSVFSAPFEIPFIQYNIFVY